MKRHLVQGVAVHTVYGLSASEANPLAGVAWYITPRIEPACAFAGSCEPMTFVAN